MLTISIPVSSGDRSLSKLKFTKVILRSRTGQERVNGLALMCIEHKVDNKF